jgi:hypothetical protein
MTSIVRYVWVDGQRVPFNAGDALEAAGARMIATGNAPPRNPNAGTNTTPSPTEIYLAELFVPLGVNAAGVALFNGGAVGGNVTVGLYDGRGIRIGMSESTPQAGAETYQRIALPLRLDPGMYWLAAQFSSAASRFRTHVFGNFSTGKLTGQVYGTMPIAMLPSTTFAPGLGPMASLY